MDLKGSLVDTKLIIHPSKDLLDYLKSIDIDEDTPTNVVKLIKGVNYKIKHKQKEDVKPLSIQLNDNDLKNLDKIKQVVNPEEQSSNDNEQKDHDENDESEKGSSENLCEDTEEKVNEAKSKEYKKNSVSKPDVYLTTTDADWLYLHLQYQRKKGGKDIPYLHNLLEGSKIDFPENEILKRNPVLEARCVKLRAQQEAREYRKMTRSVDNVRLKFPEDSIAFQMKQINRHLIGIGQFILSIFAGFLFGFKGIEWMIGSLDFGFRLLLGVICALIIALAEIYFLAKKLNEELNIPETVQLGGPVKFENRKLPYLAREELRQESKKTALNKEHQD